MTPILFIDTVAAITKFMDTTWLARYIRDRVVRNDADSFPPIAAIIEANNKRSCPTCTACVDAKTGKCPLVDYPGVVPFPSFCTECDGTEGHVVCVRCCTWCDRCGVPFCKGWGRDNCCSKCNQGSSCSGCRPLVLQECSCGTLWCHGCSYMGQCGICGQDYCPSCDMWCWECEENSGHGCCMKCVNCETDLDPEA